MLRAGDLRVERVVVESIRDFTFYATVVLAGDGESHEIDARPSDAFNLAIRVGAPVFVATELIDQAGAPAAHLPFAGTEWKAPEGMKPGGQPIGEWRSVLADETEQDPKHLAPAFRRTEHSRRGAADHS